MNNPEVKVGTILNYSIGYGCDQFWQVVSRTDKSLVAKRIEYKAINVKPKFQTCDYIPLKDKFLSPYIQNKYIGGYKEGKCRYKKADKNTITLKIADDGQIGPTKRMMWWTIWDGKPQNQWSN